MEYDYIIIGSGFGGSVSALRLAEKGYSVCILEQGKRFKDSDFPESNWNLRRYLWAPLFKCFGIQNLSLFRDILVLSGTGVGGGSLVYANTLLQPGKEFYNAPIWKDLADWEKELAPHYVTAKKMLGVTTNPYFTPADQILKECAKDLGREHTFKAVDVGIYFGKPGVTVKDPYFQGSGPDRTGCIQCGGCMVGCRHNSKNTLVKNYLYFAEKLGVKIFPETRVVNIVPRQTSASGPIQYEAHTVRSTSWFFKKPAKVYAKNIIFSAGVLGTNRLLLHCKYISKTLPQISSCLGSQIRTNSEALVGVTDLNKNIDHSKGIAITSIFHADQHTHIEPVRYSKNSSFMRILAAPMIQGSSSSLINLTRLIIALFAQPIRMIRVLFAWNWANSTIILLVMQTVDNKLRFKLGRSLFTLFRKQMVTEPEVGNLKVPVFLPIANQVGRAFANKIKGVPQSAINEILLKIPTTAHVLGGCTIGSSPSDGVVDKNQRIFGYPGLYVCDGSVIPANLGVNPSLTITALAENAMSKIPRKNGG